MHNIPVVISSGDKLIENVCYLDNISKTNYSSIASLGSTTYVMPILQEDPMEETYILTAHDVEGRYVEDITITVLPDKTFEWIVDGETDVVPADTTGL
jgi:hypothetical protein